MNEMITITREEYDRLLEAAEDLADLAVYERIKAAIASGEEELIPSALVDRMLAGESPLRVYREYRQLTQAALATASGVNRVQIADIEARRKSGSVETIRRLAEALHVTMEDLIVARDEGIETDLQ
jgi:DNA-binding XRE family transcriptional regulator